jgi:hypothetical protein
LLINEHLVRVGEQAEEDWRMVGFKLRAERESVTSAGSRQMWSVGDWLTAGEDRVFNRLKKQTVRQVAAQITGYSQHTLVMAASVSRKVGPSVRVDGLSWWHHLVVARLPETEHAHWLCQAAEQGWSVRELRTRLSRVGQTPPRWRRHRGEQLVTQLVALGPGEVRADLLAQLQGWLDQQLRRPAEVAG